MPRAPRVMHTVQRALLIVAMLVVLLASALVAIDNTQPVSLELLGWHSPEFAFFVWLFAAVGVGLLLGGVLFTLLWARQGIRIRRLDRELRRIRGKLDQRRTDTPAEAPR